MGSAFFTHTVWYVALAATSAATLILIFIKAADRAKTVAFFFAVLGFTYLLEVSLVLILGAYTYRPMLVSDAFFDSVLGNIFSQVSVSSSAVLICVLGLSNKWLIGFAAAYYLVDLLFTWLGIYVHNWYQSIYTLAGFLIYGAVVRYWYGRIFDSPPKRIYYPTLFLGIYAVTANVFGTAYKLLGIRIFQSEFFADPSKNHTATFLIYGPLLVVICIALYKWKKRPLLKGFVFLLLLVCQYGLVLSGVMVIKPGWWFLLPLDLAGFFCCTALMYRLLNGGRHASIQDYGR